jgi:hypothetical protein
MAGVSRSRRTPILLGSPLKCSRQSSDAVVGPGNTTKCGANSADQNVRSSARADTNALRDDRLGNEWSRQIRMSRDLGRRSSVR